MYHKDFGFLSVQIDTFWTNTEVSFYGNKRTAPIIRGPMLFSVSNCVRVTVLVIITNTKLSGSNILTTKTWYLLVISQL